jgi:hypothetical protein
MTEKRRTFHVPGPSGLTHPIVLRNTAPRVWRTSGDDLFMHFGHAWLGEKASRSGLLPTPIARSPRSSRP